MLRFFYTHTSFMVDRFYYLYLKILADNKNYYIYKLCCMRALLVTIENNNEP